MSGLWEYCLFLVKTAEEKERSRKAIVANLIGGIEMR